MTSVPPKLLSAFMQNIQVTGTYSSGLFSGKANTWKVDLYLNVPEYTSYPYSNTPYQYNAMDINVGDWIANYTGGKANQITSIVGSTLTNMFATVVVNDPDSYNALLDPTRQGNGIIASGNIFVFSMNQSSGLPIIAPAYSNVFDPVFGTDMISRFYYTNTLSSSIGSNQFYASTTFTTIGSTVSYIDSFSTLTYRSVQYAISVDATASNNGYQTSNFIILHNGTNVWTTEYAQIYTNSLTVALSATLFAGMVYLTGQAINGTSANVKFVRISTTP